MTYYIFRHGETYFSKNEVPYGENIESAEILPEAIPAIKKLAEFLKGKGIDAYYSSPYLRCRQTTKMFSEIISKDFIFYENLGEFRRERETIEEFILRTKGFLESLKKKDYKNIAICTHGYVVSALRELVLQGFVQKERLDDYPKTGVIMHIENGEAAYVDFNNQNAPTTP